MHHKFSLVRALLILGAGAPAHAVLLADFDGGGVPYSQAQLRDPSANGGQIRSGGPSGDYYHLLDNNDLSNGNYISFDSTGSTAGWTNVTFSMDYSTIFVAADGFSVAFLDTDLHGISGAVRAGTTGLADVEERGMYSNSIGVGFRTFNGTSATVNYGGAESTDAPYSIASGGWGSLEITMERDLSTNDVLVDVNTYTGTGRTGTQINVFDDYAISGVTLENFRVQIAGRTGGSAMTLDIDNVNLDVTAIPEPASAIFSGLTCLALSFRRRRR